MTQHRHKDSRLKWTTYVTDPDLSGLATKAEVAAEAATRATGDDTLRAAVESLAARVAAIEAPTAPQVVASAGLASVGAIATPAAVGVVEPGGKAFQPDSFQTDAFS